MTDTLAEERCGCICGCLYRGDDVWGMCGNCLAWWISQSTRGVEIKHSQVYEDGRLRDD
jgi:hypothetical protein